MKSILRTIAFLLPFLVIGCKQIIEIDLPKEDPVLVVNATFTPDSVWQARVTASQSIQVTTPPAAVTNAHVYILENGLVVDSLVHNFDDIYVSAGGRKPLAGTTYTIKASAPGFADVTGTSEAPIPVIPTQPTWRDSASVDINSIWSGEFTIGIDDPAGISNHYAIYFYALDTIIDGLDTFLSVSPVYVQTQDPVLEQDANTGAVLIQDETFDGQRRIIKVLIDSDLHHQAVMFYGFSTITEAYYRYQLTFSQYAQVGFNPFAEPVRVYSNMTPGMGIFAGFSTTFGLVP